MAYSTDGNLVSWTETWTAAITQPALETYQRIAQTPGARLQTALAWQSGGALAGAGLAAAFGWLSGGLPLATALTVIVVVPFVALVWLMLASGSAHLAARWLGGHGQFGQLVLTFAASGAPIALLTALVF